MSLQFFVFTVPAIWNLVWGLTYETYINPVFLLQKRVVRAISLAHFSSPSSPISSELKILKLHDLFQLKLLCFVYDCVTRISPSCFHSFFNLVGSVHHYSARQATKHDIFLTQKNTLQYGIRSVRFLGAKCWSDIPVDIKISHSANIFRQNLKAFKSTTKVVHRNFDSENNVRRAHSLR